MTDGPTVEQYRSVEDAHRFLNKHLFGDELQEIMISVDERDANSDGHYFHSKKFFKIGKPENIVRKIKLNPDIKETTKNDKFILMVLAHQMTHQWQYEKGTPPKSGSRYHNKEWLNKMLDNGFKSIVDSTGQKTKDEIIPNGLFDKTYTEFKEKGNLLMPWRIVKPDSTNKPTYVCRCPGFKVYGSNLEHLFCSFCKTFLSKKQEETEIKKIRPLLLTLQESVL
jgi:hypothetical protein